MHAYPLLPGNGMEDGGFVIEIHLPEEPDTNVFEFAIEDLDFFHQPALTDEEIAEGTIRPKSRLLRRRSRSARPKT